MENLSKERRRKGRRLVRRLTAALGLTLAIAPTTPTPASARERATSSPRRSPGTPPWLEPNGVTPPPRFGSAGVSLPSTTTQTSAHPAVHGKKAGEQARLFPRAGQGNRTRHEEERRAAMARHPAGKGKADPRSLTVRVGDSLWALAEGRVGREKADECWPALYRTNRSVVGPDPDHIEPGQVLEIPKECR